MHEITTFLFHECVSYSCSAKLESYLNSPCGLFNLTDRVVHATTFLEVEGGKTSSLLLLVKIKHSASGRSHWKHLPCHRRQAFLDHWRGWPNVAENQLWLLKGPLWSLFPIGSQVQVLNSLFQMLMAIYLCLYSAKTNMNSKLQTSFC